HFTTTTDDRYATATSRRYSLPLTLKMTVLSAKKLAEAYRARMSRDVRQVASSTSANHCSIHFRASPCFSQNAANRERPTIFISIPVRFWRYDSTRFPKWEP